MLILLALYGVFAFVGGLNPSWGRKWAYSSELQCDGDLYVLSLVEYFREPKVCGVHTMHSDRQAQLLMVGDSFLAETRHGPPFRQMLAKGAGMTAYDLNAFNTNTSLLNEIAAMPVPQGPRTLVVVFVERNLLNYILDRPLFALNYQPESPVDHQGWDLVRYNLQLLDLPNDKKPFDFFFDHNLFFLPILKVLRYLRFKAMGDLGSHSLAPFYDKTNRMIFYVDDWTFYKTPKVAARVVEAVQMLKAFSQTVQVKFKVKTFFVVVPNKLSIHGASVIRDFAYDNFLPEFHQRLQENGVNSIDVYKLIKDNLNRTKFYTSSDTHLSLEGKNSLLEHLLPLIRQ